MEDDVMPTISLEDLFAEKVKENEKDALAVATTLFEASYKEAVGILAATTDPDGVQRIISVRRGNVALRLWKHVGNEPRPLVRIAVLREIIRAWLDTQDEKVEDRFGDIFLNYEPLEHKHFEDGVQNFIGKEIHDYAEQQRLSSRKRSAA